MNISKDGQQSLLEGRILIWFSCGAASACAGKIAVDKYRSSNVELIYCDTLKYEHPDNRRFLADCEKWINPPGGIKILRSKLYTDIFDVFDKTGWLVGPRGARCTTELKKQVRIDYQNPEDVHIFGLTADEEDRISLFEKENPDIWLEWNLRESGLKKRDCLQMVHDAGIELPAMYKLGYHNNNCIGCVKGYAGYWNKIRKDFPEAFARMAQQERKMGVSIIRKTIKGQKDKISQFLDELPVDAGNYKDEPDIECGPQCKAPTLAEYEK